MSNQNPAQYRSCLHRFKHTIFPLQFIQFIWTKYGCMHNTSTHPIGPSIPFQSSFSGNHESGCDRHQSQTFILTTTHSTAPDKYKIEESINTSKWAALLASSLAWQKNIWFIVILTILCHSVIKLKWQLPWKLSILFCISAIYTIFNRKTFDPKNEKGLIWHINKDLLGLIDDVNL